MKIVVEAEKHFFELLRRIFGVGGGAACLRLVTVPTS
jgi:hypothetical protein